MPRRASNLKPAMSEPLDRLRIQFTLAGPIAETIHQLADLYRCAPGDVARQLTIQAANHELARVLGRVS